MKVVTRKVTDLIPYENNPRDHLPLIDRLADAIRLYGFNVPILIRSNNQIVDGHGRWKAAQKVGLTEVPCIIVDHLSEEQLRAFRISINQLATLADWDLEKLEKEIQDLSKQYDISKLSSLTSFDSDLVSNLLEESPAPTSGPGDVSAVPNSSIHTLTNDVLFDVTGAWDLPRLRDDRLYRGCAPATWIGPKTAPADSYLYIYSTDSPEGLDWSKAVVGFYTADHKLEPIWNNTAGIVKRFLEKQIAGAITPDFSVIFTWPHPLNVYNMYRNLFVGRYLQEAGIPIVVNMSAARLNELQMLLELTPKAAIVARQIQASYSKKELEIERVNIKELLKSKHAVWFYGTEKSADKLGIKTSEQVSLIVPRMALRREKLGF